ncbi:trichohyalin-like [Penaeus vannamei]|uniref:trichohyalin-like n=1 Tax=Penaeus vannamei TaxID=6689 RepID=UPI00387F80A9
MAEEQTDWLACGVRRTRAQRVNEILEAKEADRRAQLHHRRVRLRRLLEEEHEEFQREMDLRLVDFRRREGLKTETPFTFLRTSIRTYSRLSPLQKHEERLAEIAALREQEETERAKRVHLADEMRRRQQCHQYREAYSREVQRYINDSRPHEITLRNQMRELYGVNMPPGKRS